MGQRHGLQLQHELISSDEALNIALHMAGGSREQKRSAARPVRRLPSGVAKDSDVLDVWFEKREADTERRRKGR